MIELFDYKSEPTFHIGKPAFKKVLKYRFNFQDEYYLVEVELDYQNVPLITLYELDDNTVKYVGDTGKNLFLVFNKMVVTKDELIDHCNEWLFRIKYIFKNRVNA